MPNAIGTFVIALLFPITWGMGQTSLEVSRGWDRRERAGRWNPLFVRAANHLPRDVNIGLNAATEGGFGAEVREHVAIGPSRGTFELYAPTHYAPASQGVIIVSDSESGRTLAQSIPPLRQSTTQPAQVGPNGIFVGISGKAAGVEGLRSAGAADGGYLPPRLLPRSAIGYDGIECLFLNQPDLGSLEPGQQNAILEWVGAGGGLLLVPSEKPLPTHLPLLEALPCSIGDVELVNLPAGVLQQAGIPPRFSHLSSRHLTPTPNGESLELIAGSKISGYWRRYGLGRILVAPIDLASVDFETTRLKEKSAAFWRPILTTVTSAPAPEPKRQYDTPYYGHQSESEDQEREGAAVGTVCDFVSGSAPSAGRRMPVVLLAILLIIGPVDSIVLFMLGKRPWTWTTAAGWVALFAGGVAFLLPHMQPARTECRSIRVIDQVDDATVARTDLVAVWSSGRSHIVEDGPAIDGRWWQPAVPGLARPQDLRAQSDIEFHQSDSGNEPQHVTIEPGEPRFLRADQLASAPPILKVELALRKQEHATLLVGTIQNVSAYSLTMLRIRAKFGVVAVPNGGRLLPGQVLQIRLPAAGGPFAPQRFEAQYQSYGYFGSRHLNATVDESDLWAVAPDLSGRRSLRVDEYVDGRGGFCCVYAELEKPGPVFFPAGSRNTEQAFCWVRALAPLGS